MSDKECCGACLSAGLQAMTLSLFGTDGLHTVIWQEFATNEKKRKKSKALTILLNCYEGIK